MVKTDQQLRESYLKHDKEVEGFYVSGNIPRHVIGEVIEGETDNDNGESE